MNFLSLCQTMARESGTISGVQPTSVTGQTGRLLKVVNWVADAWLEIQNDRNAWKWLRDEFEGDTVASQDTYTAASWNLTRPASARWIIEPGSVTMYEVAKGVADEDELRFREWSEFRRMWKRGEQTDNRPLDYSINPAGAFVLGPKPDGVYKVRGMYRKGPQTLAANADVPEMPEQFHMLIAWRALAKLDGHDEATPQAVAEALRHNNLFTEQLERDQLPRPCLGGGPLA